MPLVLIAGAGLFILFLAALVIRVSVQFVAGLRATLGSILLTMLFSTILSSGAGALAQALRSADAASFGVAVSLFALLAHIGIYTVVIRDAQGTGLTYGQAFLVLLLQIPVGIVIVIGIFLLLAATGYTLGSLSPARLPLSMPHLPAVSSAPATPVPTPAKPTSGVLRAPVSISTPYGRVVLAVGTTVQILETNPAGYRVKANAHEFQLAADQLIVTPPH